MNISIADLIMELEACRAITSFMSEAVSLILEENAGFTEICPVPHGAGASLDMLSDRLQQLIKRVSKEDAGEDHSQDD